jgi:hypothetical protein
MIGDDFQGGKSPQGFVFGKNIAIAEKQDRFVSQLPQTFDRAG